MSEIARPPKKKDNKKIYGIIAIFLLILAIGILSLAYLNRPQGSIQPGMIGISRQGEVIAVLTLQDIQALPKVEKKVTINSASEGKSTDIWGGAAMKEVLDLVEPRLLLDAEQIFTRAEDGFTSALTPEEITVSDAVLIAYEKNGELLKSKAEGGLGPFRLILTEDPFGNRMTKYLNEVEIK